MFDSTQHAAMLQTLQTQLNELPSLMAAYQQIEPLILQAFGAKRMSLFQRRLQHQDLVARFKTGKKRAKLKSLLVHSQLLATLQWHSNRSLLTTRTTTNS
jgi:hypothetical protein